MKHYLLLALALSFQTAPVQAAQIIPGYNFNKTLTGSTPSGKGFSVPYSIPCKQRAMPGCIEGFISVTDASDLTALETKISEKILNAKNELLMSQSSTTQSVISSDELKEAIRAIVREELKKTQEQ